MPEIYWITPADIAVAFAAWVAVTLLAVAVTVWVFWPDRAEPTPPPTAVEGEAAETVEIRPRRGRPHRTGTIHAPHLPSVPSTDPTVVIEVRR